MASIVITPFDREHASELYAFVHKVLEKAAFNEEMPACIERLEVRSLQQVNQELKAVLADLLASASQGDVHKWQQAQHKAQLLLTQLG